MAVIEGEAGVGKTRLAYELAHRAGAAGAAVLAARCHDDEVGLPYGPIVELLQGALGHPDWPTVLPLSTWPMPQSALGTTGTAPQG